MSEQPIYEFIMESLVDGALPPDFSLAQRDRGGQGLLETPFADGALDGISVYHMGPPELPAGLQAIIGEGISQVNFNKMITLNDSAAYLWQSVEGKEFSVEDLTRLLTDKYEVSDEKAAADAAALAGKWIEAGIVEE